MNNQIKQIISSGYKELRKQREINGDKNNTLIKQRKLHTPRNA